ncbi:MAG: hypothetical protein NVS1B11_30470 [Terriglobales bacterium]
MSQFPQLAKVEPLFAVAVRVTAVPLGKLWLHVIEQLSPEGELVMDPEPAPLKLAVSNGPLLPPPEPVKHTTLAVI